jgi:hypothetical protein
MTARVPHLRFALDPLIAEAKRRMRRRRYLIVLALVAATAVATALTLGLRPGESSRGGISASTYSGRLYSVQDVKRAFAQFGWKLRPAASRQHGVVTLKSVYSFPGTVVPPTATRDVVEVATLRSMVGKEPTLPGRRTSFANVTIFGSFGLYDYVRGALSALRWGTVARGKPADHLIVPGKSIGPFRLSESRAAVEKSFGPGTNGHYRRDGRVGFVSYFGGRVEVIYEFHAGVYNFVTGLSTRSSRYHTSSGIHVGSSEQALRKLFVTCVGKTMCYVLAGPWPDAETTIFTLRHGRVTEISFGNG